MRRLLFTDELDWRTEEEQREADKRHEAFYNRKAKIVYESLDWFIRTPAAEITLPNFYGKSLTIDKPKNRDPQLFREPLPRVFLEYAKECKMQGILFYADNYLECSSCPPFSTLGTRKSTTNPSLTGPASLILLPELWKIIMDMVFADVPYIKMKAKYSGSCLDAHTWNILLCLADIHDNEQYDNYGINTVFCVKYDERYALYKAVYDADENFRHIM